MATFTVVVTLLAPSAGMAITVIGLSLLAGRLLIGRGIGRLERSRARLLLGVDVPAPGSIPRGRRRFTDRVGWASLAYSLLVLPVGALTGTLCVIGWVTGVAAIAFPTYARGLSGAGLPVGSLSVGGLAVDFGSVTTGAAVLTAMPTVVRGLTRIDSYLIRHLLG